MSIRIAGRRALAASTLIVAVAFASAPDGPALAAATVTSHAQHARHAPVFGKLIADDAQGYGTAHPRKIYDGGTFDYNHISWTHWGRAHARARGKTQGYNKHGQHFRKQVGLQLRAWRIGHCPGQARRAYTRARVRYQKRPGGSWGPWQSSTNICTSEV